jgi:V-type H+-transporting ATPase subunit F
MNIIITHNNNNNNNMKVANEIRHILKDYNKTIPTVLEIPSKDSP